MPRFKHSNLLVSVSLMLLFWTIFDGIICFFTPLYIVNLGYTKTQMGFLIAASNIFGAIFDFILAKYLNNTHYRRLFLILFGVCFIYPAILWSSNGLWLFLIATAFWGLYGDLQNFASFDFVSHYATKKENSQTYGIISMFRALGYFIGPIVAGWLMVTSINELPLIFAVIFLLISFLFYLTLLWFTRQDNRTKYQTYRRSNFFHEIYLWKKIGITLLPVLIFNTIICTFDGVFWSIGPLFSQVFSSIKDFNGILLAIYMLPSILVGWIVGYVTQKHGKKKTAYMSFFVANIFIIFLGYTRSPYLILSLIFLSSLASSFTWPAIRGAYSDYISETDKYEKEIEGINDFTTNLGYIIGPITGGILADRFGITYGFTILGFANLIIIFLLFLITPKNINISIPTITPKTDP